MASTNYNPMSGAPDYRSDAGVTPDDMMYLSQKRTLLSMGGTILDDIYYSAMNTTVALSEVTYNTGRLAVSLSQTQFGSQSQVLIPNSSLLAQCYLHLELPPLVADQAICRGWGYALIDQISFLFGSSNVSQIAMNGQSLWQTIAGQCETEEKRSEMFHLGGEESFGPNPFVAGPPLTADLLIPLPWSAANGLHAKLPFDTGLLSNPITIQITFKAAAAVYGGTGAKPAGFTKATMYMRQGDLANKSQSMKSMMMRRPDLMYAYPFIHKQTFTPSTFNGSTDSSAPCTVPLLAFINADLIGMTVGVIRSDRLAPSGNLTPMPFGYDGGLSNITLDFNGLQMLNAPGRSHKLYGIDSQVGCSKFLNSVVLGTTNATPFQSGGEDTYTLYIDFSRVRALSFEGQYANVWRIGNNTLTLRFNTSAGTPQAPVSYTLFATYFYNAVAEISNGETRIYMD
jgi:hypothetical protein